MILLAHRGLWLDPAERNTRDAFRAAFDRGFGVELDVRDQGGRLVISHDMAVGDCLPFETVLTDYAAAGMPGRLAVNVKADGLAAPIAAALADAGATTRSFVFDMSVPDMLAYLPRGVPVFTRHSEHEPVPPLEDRTAGTWFDCFEQPWVDPALVVSALRRGRAVAIVSPELHQRDCYRKSWSRLTEYWSETNLSWRELSQDRMLCTDYPVEAERFFADHEA